MHVDVMRTSWSWPSADCSALEWCSCGRYNHGPSSRHQYATIKLVARFASSLWPALLRVGQISPQNALS